jgi:hypothetical protein
VRTGDSMDAPGEATGVQVRRLSRAGDGPSRGDGSRPGGSIGCTASAEGWTCRRIARVRSPIAWTAWSIVCAARGIPWTRPSVEWAVPSGSWSSWPIRRT